MATYQELYSLFTDSSLRNRVAVAVMKEAQTLLDGTPTAADINWAAAVLSDPTSEARKAFFYVLATNSALTVETIQGATDAALQTQVAAAIPSLVTAHNAV